MLSIVFERLLAVCNRVVKKGLYFWKSVVKKVLYFWKSVVKTTLRIFFSESQKCKSFFFHFISVNYLFELIYLIIKDSIEVMSELTILLFTKPRQIPNIFVEFLCLILTRRKRVHVISELKVLIARNPWDILHILFYFLVWLLKEFIEFLMEFKKWFIHKPMNVPKVLVVLIYRLIQNCLEWILIILELLKFLLSGKNGTNGGWNNSTSL